MRARGRREHVRTQYWCSNYSEQARNASRFTETRHRSSSTASRSQSSMKLLWLVAAAGGAGLAAGLAPPGALFLGIDLSTQSCTAVVVDQRLDAGHRHSVNFDERFPEYGTESGYHAGDEGTATSPVAMWLDGLDCVLDAAARITAAAGRRHFVQRPAARRRLLVFLRRHDY